MDYNSFSRITDEIISCIEVGTFMFPHQETVSTKLLAQQITLRVFILNRNPKKFVLIMLL